MSNTRRPLMVDDQGRKMFKWQIRIYSKDPTVIEFKELHYEEKAPMEEMGKLIWRTSWMRPGGPHREVWWAMDLWRPDKGDWECVVDGKSKLTKTAKPL